MKHWDERGQERVLPAFVFLGSFITMSILIVSQMPQMMAYGASGDWQDYQGIEILGNTTFALWTPQDGYTVNDTYVLDRYDEYWDDAEAAHRLLFWKDNSNELRRLMVNVIRDNHYLGWWGTGQAGKFKDYIMVAQKQPIMFGYADQNAYKAISYERIAAAYRVGTNTSIIGFDIGKYNYSLIIGINSTGWLEHLYRNEFVIRLGKPLFGEGAELAKQSMWTILGQILTASLPNVNWVVNWMISIPIWAAAGFIVFTIITRAIWGG